MVKYAKLAIELLGALTFDELMADVRTQLACLDCVRTVGEAATWLPME